MNYWIISDTHFGHDKLMEYSNRPKDFENLILKNLKNTINGKDVLIHLGDFCIGNDATWHEKFMEVTCFKRWLIKGNHDRKTNHWYLNHGWDFVAESMQLRMFGKNILFSHIPQTEDINIVNEYDLNIHGHLHNNAHHPECEISDKNLLIMMEHHYKSQSLRRIVENNGYNTRNRRTT